MYTKKILSIFIFALLASFTVISCGSSSKAVKNYTPSSDISGLALDASESPSVLYKRPNAPTLAAYDSFIIDPVTFDSRDIDVKKLEPEDLGRIKTYFNDSMTKELEQGGYTVTTKAGEKTMRISFVVSGVSIPNASANVVGVLLPIAIKVGGVTVEAAFRESVSNRIDAVAVARSEGSKVFNSSPWSTWADIESALDQWAKGIRQAVDKAHGK